MKLSRVEGKIFINFVLVQQTHFQGIVLVSKINVVPAHGRRATADIYRHPLARAVMDLFENAGTVCSAPKGLHAGYA